jgi:Polyketide cyclase / dehydrase and lipid transport
MIIEKQKADAAMLQPHGVPELWARSWRRELKRIPEGEAVTRTVVTRVSLNASPETAWERIVFYEEVMARPPFPLRAYVPQPLRSEGNRSRVGAVLQCACYGGEIVKRITAMAPPRRIWFEVVDQRLGIESCVRALDGSYEFRSNGAGCDVVLTTRYNAYLHPRWLWHPIEKGLMGKLHRHILNSMRSTTDGKTVTVVGRVTVSPQRGGWARDPSFRRGGFFGSAWPRG